MSGRGRYRIAAITAAVLVVIAVCGIGWTRAASAERSRSKTEATSEQRLITLRVQLRRSEVALTKAKTDLEDAEAAVADLRGQLNTDDKEARVREDKVNQLKAALEARTKELDAKQADVTAREAALGTRSADLDKRQAEMDKRQAEQDARQQQLDAYQASLSQQPAPAG